MVDRGEHAGTAVFLGSHLELGKLDLLGDAEIGLTVVEDVELLELGGKHGVFLRSVCPTAFGYLRTGLREGRCSCSAKLA